MSTATNESHAKRKRGHQARPAAGPGRRSEPGDLAAELKALGPEAEAFFRRLALVNEFGLWKDCGREPCRRARKCRGDDAECYDERRGAP